jgi:hypothetical protein
MPVTFIRRSARALPGMGQRRMLVALAVAAGAVVTVRGESPHESSGTTCICCRHGTPRPRGSTPGLVAEFEEVSNYLLMEAVRVSPASGTTVPVCCLCPRSVVDGPRYFDPKFGSTM